MLIASKCPHDRDDGGIGLHVHTSRAQNAKRENINATSALHLRSLPRRLLLLTIGNVCEPCKKNLGHIGPHFGILFYRRCLDKRESIWNRHGIREISPLTVEVLLRYPRVAGLKIADPEEFLCSEILFFENACLPKLVKGSVQLLLPTKFIHLPKYFGDVDHYLETILDAPPTSEYQEFS